MGGEVSTNSPVELQEDDNLQILLVNEPDSLQPEISKPLKSDNSLTGKLSDSVENFLTGPSSIKPPVKPERKINKISIENRIIQDANIDKVWKLFLDIHQLPENTCYVMVESDKKFVEEASLCWLTDVCDILRRYENGEYILRRKELLRLPKRKL